ncbi:AraC family transcriptional regulator [Caulobacter sp. CCNWLY153]|uniref:helix-turn-helix domain-containing protein n=1 Tax=unclassified Caulobacter TaxID=2648921 RepID=UPI002FEF6925
MCVYDPEPGGLAPPGAFVGGKPAGLAPWQASRAAAYVEHRLETTIRVVDLARAARLSPSYFSRAFKTTFGLSPQKYVVERRLTRAKRIMLTTDEPLCGIAVTCGFSDQAHLSRLFRRREGAPPNAWRRERRQASAAL